jgi:hypothetical protein
MRATEFIRGLLDLIDSVDEKQTQVNDYEDEVAEPETTQRRQYSNTPDEQVTSSEVVFSIGNDINKPKHPSDIRSDSLSMYPNMQYKGK